jgi:hypothetical protein
VELVPTRKITLLCWLVHLFHVFDSQEENNVIVFGAIYKLNMGK